MYHAVGTTMPPGLADLSVPASLLDEHLAALRDDGWELLGLTEALLAHAEGRRVVALTFDDGYRDFLEQAVDVLGRHDARATLYVPTRDLGGRASWLPGAAGDLALMTADEVAAVAGLGVEVGSHGAVHVPMDVLPGDRALADLSESRARLEEVVGADVVSFCYPHGYHSRSLRHRVADAGYRNACSIGHRLHADGADPLAVSRVMATPTTTAEALRRLVVDGPPPWRPRLKRAATPAWRLARRTAHLTTGRTLT